ncbi:hypothetical protein KR009_011207 [Drosophila setifemur]|nr:hypothetical protein KR009_011207 [Drosophila setifemur]
MAFNLIIIPLCGVTGIICFVTGAVVQQYISYKRIKSVMVNDAYVFRSRHRVFNAVRRYCWIIVNTDTSALFQLELLGKTSKNMRASRLPRSEREQEIWVGTEVSDIQDSYSAAEQFFSWVRLRATNFARSIKNQVRCNRNALSAESQQMITKKDVAHIANIMKYGFPGMDEILIYKNFVVSFDRRNRIAHWVCEHLSVDCFSDIDPKTLHKPSEYTADSAIPAMFCPTMRDFRNSDWVGGHMASPHNYKCDFVSFIDAYKFPNIVPIHRGLKTNIWLRLEHYVRELAFTSAAVYVYTGPLFMPQRTTFRNWAIRHHVMGLNTVAVPTHFFKVIIAEQKDEEGQVALPFMEGYVVPNADLDKDLELRSFQTKIRDIEHFAGLKFYDGQVRDQRGVSFAHHSQDYHTN